MHINLAIDALTSGEIACSRMCSRSKFVHEIQSNQTNLPLGNQGHQNLC